MTFAFVSAHPALDLAGTLKWRRDPEPEELLGAPEDLRRWFDESADFPAGLEVDAAVLASARALREAVYALVAARLAGRDFAPADLAVVNRLAAGPGLRVELNASGVRRTGGGPEALADLARSAVDVLADPDACLKECGRPRCTRVYLDRSRGARRTWCGMEECGNRVKAAAYRARKRGERPTSD